jgi:hypothetical protein
MVCLGATPSQAFFGRDFRVIKERGRLLETSRGLPTVVTVHPSSILRQTTREDRHREMAAFVAELRVAAGVVRRRAGDAGLQPACSSPGDLASTSAFRWLGLPVALRLLIDHA